MDSSEGRRGVSERVRESIEGQKGDIHTPMRSDSPSMYAKESVDTAVVRVLRVAVSDDHLHTGRDAREGRQRKTERHTQHTPIAEGYEKGQTHTHEERLPLNVREGEVDTAGVRVLRVAVADHHLHTGRDAVQ